MELKEGSSTFIYIKVSCHEVYVCVSYSPIFFIGDATLVVTRFFVNIGIYKKIANPY